MNSNNLLTLEQNTILKHLLNISWVDVTFTKKDGSLRKMKSTTNFKLIPEEHHPKSKTPTADSTDKTFAVEENPDILYSVYEEGKGWRSFRYSQILKFEVEVRTND